ncbi:hypothetical protein CHAB381_1540 [Campylobacter hominis ATCC BAA-381]|uniref:Uncharacterized protein n=1 Tax=Campylobacter hominis (strain ATCC BAA-381 / DSM 21671 / CCUG 45161 / LMG 19568 / NCTC 13146 / CH001A) TaxID=360107 RepID=A7I3I1_CAMHC|nr:hypothetical protein CHAB381_1540 [Campylobacter hominis ATCC BAA-381]
MQYKDKIIRCLIIIFKFCVQFLEFFIVLYCEILLFLFAKFHHFLFF